MKDDKFRELVNLFLDSEISPQDLQLLQKCLAEEPHRLEEMQRYVRLREAERLLFSGISANGQLKRTRLEADPQKVENETCRRFINQAFCTVAVVTAVVGFLSFTGLSRFFIPDLPLNASQGSLLVTQGSLATGLPPLTLQTDTPQSFESSGCVAISLVISGGANRETVRRRLLLESIPHKNCSSDELAWLNGRTILLDAPSAAILSERFPSTTRPALRASLTPSASAGSTFLSTGIVETP